LRESYAQWTPVERAVQAGDRVGLDLWVGVEGRDAPLHDTKDAEYVVDPEGAQPVPGFAEKLVGMQAGGEQSFSVELPADYRQADVAGQTANARVTLHWVKERQLPELDDEFAQQVGEYADAKALHAAVETQVREREEQRVREQLEEASLNKLVEISSIEFPPQLIEHQTQHMLDTFTRNVERQGLQLQQYLRLVGKDQESFESDLRAEAESNIRRSLALDAFANAEKIGVEQAEVADEVRRAAAGTDESAAVEELAMNNPNTLQRVEEVTRERKALNRLIELATSNGHAPARGKKKDQAEEKPAAATQTSDTEGHSREAQPSLAAAAEEEGTA
jgi:trigger factor